MDIVVQEQSESLLFCKSKLRSFAADRIPLQRASKPSSPKEHPRSESVSKCESARPAPKCLAAQGRNVILCRCLFLGGEGGAGLGEAAETKLHYDYISSVNKTKKDKGSKTGAHLRDKPTICVGMAPLLLDLRIAVTSILQKSI